MSEFLEVPSKKESLQKILRDIFISPVDAFDFYLNAGLLTRGNLFLFHILLWSYAPLMKFSLNGIFLYLHEEASETPKPVFFDGLLLSFLVYPILFSLGFILDSFRNYYKKFEFFKEDPIQGIWNLSFLPISTSFVFWILPKPFNAMGVILSCIFSLNLYYSALLNLDNFKKSDFIRMILYFLTSMGILTFILILIGNYIRTKL